MMVISHLWFGSTTFFNLVKGFLIVNNIYIIKQEKEKELTH